MRAQMNWPQEVYFNRTDNYGKCIYCKVRHHPGRVCPKLKKKAAKERAKLNASKR